MSMIRCDGCEAIFDSDGDPDCFVEIGNMRRLHKEVVWCEWCRDRYEAEQDLGNQMASLAEEQS